MVPFKLSDGSDFLLSDGSAFELSSDNGEALRKVRLAIHDIETHLDRGEEDHARQKLRHVKAALPSD